MSLPAAEPLTNLPVLSLGIALALAIPLLALGGLFLWSGQKLMKPLIAFASGVVGALVGLIIASLLQNNIAMIFLPLAGLGVGIGLGLVLFRAAAATVAGAMTFMLVASLGASALAPAMDSSNASPGEPADAPDSALAAHLPEATPQPDTEKQPSQSTPQSADRSELASSLRDLANESITRAKAAAAGRPANSFEPRSDAEKEYVDVRQLRVGDNPLAVEEVRAESGHRHLVIRSGPSPEELKKLEAQQESPLAKLSAKGFDLDAIRAPGAMLERLHAEKLLPEATSQRFAALMDEAPGQASRVPVGPMLVMLLLAASIGATTFGLAIWKHKHTVALVAAGLGAAFLVSGVSVIVFAAAPDARWLTGLMGSLLFTGLWLAVTALGATSQLRRARAIQLDGDAGGAGGGLGGRGIAGSIRAKPAAQDSPRKKITRIPPASEKKAA
jgi:hypothetical protein